uniref:ATP synthase complex subunit 8 n=1 Tax=Carnegiella strigata TaxID=642546 RepID=F7UIF8_9TELE|nr:ATPase subunit 8 [Carnegiella strigata]
MPQLNPAPWLTILIFSWLIFITIIPSKILKHTFSNNPSSTKTEKPTITSWNWPWH